MQFLNNKYWKLSTCIDSFIDTNHVWNSLIDIHTYIKSIK